MFVPTAADSYRYTALGNPAPARHAPTTPATGGHRLRHGLEHLLQCVGCAHGGDESEPVQRQPPFGLPSMAPPVHVSVTRLRQDPRDARFRVLPASFPKADAVLAYEVPGVDGGTRYHECQEGSRCGLHVLNMLAMALSGNDFAMLSRRSDLHAFIVQRHGALHSNCYLDEDLRDFHNHFHARLPCLGLASAGVDAQGTLVFAPVFEVPEGVPHAAGIDAAPAVGLTFAFRNGEADMVHTVLVRRAGPERFEMMDSLTPRPRHIHALSMTQAIAGFVARLGVRGGGQALSVLYPAAGGPAPMEPVKVLTWF